MTIYIVTASKITVSASDTIDGAVMEAERLRDKTGNSVVVRRGDSHICTFLGRHEWKLAKKRMQR